MIKSTSVLLAAVLLLGPLLALEMGMRELIGSGRLPEAPTSNDEADVSLANLVRLGRPDVLIIGTSAIRASVQPDVLEDLIANETGQDVHVQNAGQPGMSFESQRILVRELARLDLLPDIVLTGLTPVSLGDDQGGEDDWFQDSELGRLWNGCPEGLIGTDWLECQLGQHSALWRWRGHPDRVAEALAGGMPTTIVEERRTLHENGWLDTRPSTPKRLRLSTQAALERVETQANVSDVVVNDFAPLIEELRSHGTEVVALGLPYHAELEKALVERNPDWRQERDASYARLEAAADIDIVKVTGYGDWAKASSFRDPRHLSREGAGPFTRQLWEMAGFREPLLEALTSAD